MIAILLLELLDMDTRVACVLRRPHRWLEDNFYQIPVPLEKIFYQRTWSFNFLDTYLLPEYTDMWDHISVWYTLSEAFCERNIDWLNFHDLVYCQALRPAFYLRHADRLDWISNPVDRQNLFDRLYP